CWPQLTVYRAFCHSAMDVFGYIAHHSARLHRDLTTFPTRRSSDLDQQQNLSAIWQQLNQVPSGKLREAAALASGETAGQGGCLADRKSTRLNSSHVKISYAVFCLKKKTRQAFHELQPTVYTLTCNA